MCTVYNIQYTEIGTLGAKLLTGLGGGDDVALILDRSRAQKHLPMGLPSLESERRGDE